ncbi:MAG: AMP-binding protein [Bacteroidales bacterium]|nr:AMP-binding protein [Bacteroidales bacterium]HOI31503.1 AMP-binding protein [Bacteroidales bacterium]
MTSKSAVSLHTIFENSIRTNADRQAFSDYGASGFTYQQIAEQILLIHRIFEGAHIHKEDKIALSGHNSSAWAISFLSILSYGAIVVPILPDFSTENIHHIVNHSDARLFFASASVLGRIDPEHLPNIQGIISLVDMEVNFEAKNNLKAVVKNARQITLQQEEVLNLMKFEAVDPDEVAVISYTSGTSGFTKGVMLPYRSLWSNIIFAQEHMPLHAGDQIVSFLPLAHVFGLLFEFLFPFTMGCHVNFLTKVPSPAIVTKAFGEIKPHLILSVPLVIEKIYKKRILPKIDKPMMKLLLKTPVIHGVIEQKVNKALTETFGERFSEIVIGGAPLSEEVEQFFRKIGFRYTVGYGMTECGPLISYSGHKQSRFRSAGKVVDRMQIRIEKEDAINETGEVQVKGDNLMLGYYKNDADTKKAFTDDGWLRTGDLGYLDSKGYLYLKGRSKNMLLGPSGQNIYPEELEARIMNLPCVAECVVKQQNGKLVAMIYPDREAMECDRLDFPDIENKMKEMLKHLNKELPAYEQISEVEIVDVEFVKTPKKNIKRYLYT